MNPLLYTPDILYPPLTSVMSVMAFLRKNISKVVVNSANTQSMHLNILCPNLLLIYSPGNKQTTTIKYKLKRAKIFSIMFSVNCENANFNKVLNFDQILTKIKYNENEYMYLPYESTEAINAVGEHALETFIQWFCPHEVSSMLYNKAILAVLTHAFNFSKIHFHQADQYHAQIFRAL